VTNIQEARDVLAKWRDKSKPGPWTFTVDTYGSDFGDYRAAEIPDVAVSVWTENDGPVAPLDPADAALIVGTAGNPELLDAIDGILEAALESLELLILPDEYPDFIEYHNGQHAESIAAAIIAADERMNA
jgi:hypothetical protein